MTIEEKGMDSINTILLMRGVSILERGWNEDEHHFAFIGLEDGCLVFVDSVIYPDLTNGFPEKELDRKACELAAAHYLKNAEDLRSSPVRFDCIELVAVNENHALIRHRVNAL